MIEVSKRSAIVTLLLSRTRTRLLYAEAILVWRTVYPLCN